MTISIYISIGVFLWIVGIFTFSYPFARLCESYMNAEQFTCPEDDRSVLWHRLKYPRVIFTVLHGATGLFVFLFSSAALESHVFGFTTYLLGELISVGIAWAVFETFLSFFRGIIKCQK